MPSINKLVGSAVIVAFGLSKAVVTAPTTTSFNLDSRNITGDLNKRDSYFLWLWVDESCGEKGASAGAFISDIDGFPFGSCVSIGFPANSASFGAFNRIANFYQDDCEILVSAIGDGGGSCIFGLGTVTAVMVM